MQDDMLPLIIYSNSKNKTSQFLNDLIAENNFLPHLIYSIHPLKEEISISQIRELKAELTINQVNQRLIIFYDFHKSSLEAQNALLKILEDQTEKNQFVLISINIERILPTIKSRTKTIYLDKQNKIIPVDNYWSNLFEQIRSSSTINFLNNEKLVNLSKDEAINFCNQAITYFYNELSKEPEESSSILRIIKKIFQLSYQLENNNLNSSLTLDNLLIFIWKSYNNYNSYKDYKK